MHALGIYTCFIFFTHILYRNHLYYFFLKFFSYNTFWSCLSSQILSRSCLLLYWPNFMFFFLLSLKKQTGKERANKHVASCTLLSISPFQCFGNLTIGSPLPSTQRHLPQWVCCLSIPTLSCAEIMLGKRPFSSHKSLAQEYPAVNFLSIIRGLGGCYC